MGKSRVVQGKVRSALISVEVPFFNSRKLHGRAAMGVRYERKVVEHLSSLAIDQGFESHPGPWIRYADSEGWFWCQPDFVAVGDERIYIHEVKLKHTAQAWCQLNYLYSPVCAIAFPGRQVLIETCKYLTPQATSHQMVEPFSPTHGVYHYLG